MYLLTYEEPSRRLRLRLRLRPYNVWMYKRTTTCECTNVERNVVSRKNKKIKIIRSNKRTSHRINILEIPVITSVLQQDSPCVRVGLGYAIYLSDAPNRQIFTVLKIWHKTLIVHVTCIACMKLALLIKGTRNFESSSQFLLLIE